MATIVNTTPAPAREEGSGMGFFLGVILLLLAVVLFVIYALPAIRNAAAPQIQVPGKVDVNVQTPQSK